MGLAVDFSILNAHLVDFAIALKGSLYEPSREPLPHTQDTSCSY